MVAEFECQEKWLKHGKDLKVGDTVLVISPDTRGQWTMALIQDNGLNSE